MGGLPGRGVSALVVTIGIAVASAAPRAADPRFRLTGDATGGVPFFLGVAADKSGYRSGDADLAVWALAEWERSLGGIVHFTRVDEEGAARLRFRWLPWAEDAALGRMEPSAANGVKVATINITPDEHRFRPTVKRRILEDPLMRDVVLYYVCLHEIGHALGLAHSDQPRDVMWPGVNGVTLPIYDRYRHHLMMRDDIAKTSWLSPNDIARVRKLWKR